MRLNALIIEIKNKIKKASIVSIFSRIVNNIGGHKYVNR